MLCWYSKCSEDDVWRNDGGCVDALYEPFELSLYTDDVCGELEYSCENWRSSPLFPPAKSIANPPRCTASGCVA